VTLRLSIRPGFVAVLCGLLLLDWALPWLLLTTAAVHELGHLLALQCLGTQSAVLELTAAGCIIDCAPLPRRALVITALAGPLANLLWAGLILRPAPTAALMSLSMAAFNLLPIPPLDGGTALQALAGSRAIPPTAAVTAGVLLALAFAARRTLGAWPLLLCLWILCRAAGEWLAARHKTLAQPPVGMVS